LTSVGVFYKNFPVMLFSRFVFGIGGESLSVAQNTYASAWFKGNILNFVFGLQVIPIFLFIMKRIKILRFPFVSISKTSVARVGSTVNFQVVEPLFKALRESFEIETALGWTLLIAGISCLVSLISATVRNYLKKGFFLGIRTLMLTFAFQILGLLDKRREKATLESLEPIPKVILI